MFKILFNVLFGVITSIVNIVMTPINLLVSNFIPNFSSMIATFNYVLENYIGNGIAYFFSMVPPMTKNVMLTFISFYISYYTVSIAVHGIIKVYAIIKKIKIW